MALALQPSTGGHAQEFFSCFLWLRWVSPRLVAATMSVWSVHFDIAGAPDRALDLGPVLGLGLGPVGSFSWAGTEEVREERTLNRVIRITNDGWEMEPDQRHADTIIESVGHQRSQTSDISICYGNKTGR